MAQRSAFGQALSHNEDTDLPVSGLGELRARKPGNTAEKDRAVRLQSHDVKIRVAGTVARTEIDETFFNDTDDVLEGVYRFPLPPGAEIERLALEVDGKMIEGEFTDKAKAAAIWRGAIQNAAPKAPKPRAEIIWVPGPWRDPALLEWQQGGRFELKIFPIPKRGSRRVVIAYTETVQSSGNMRRYTYPLPQSTASALTIGNFHVDARVVGFAKQKPVRVRGYELTQAEESGGVRFSGNMSSFTPSGDLTVEYEPEDARADAVAWAFTDNTGKSPESFAAIALRPKLPHATESAARDQVIVVDAGRSMTGERYVRARRLATQIVSELDRRDRVTVLACDVECKQLGAGFVAPGGPGAHDVDAFLAGVTPDGASDLVGAVRSAQAAAGRDKARELKVTIISDGVPSAGYRSTNRLADRVREVLSGEPKAVVVSVPVGAQSNTTALSEIARGGGGVMVSYEPGESLETAAMSVVSATYGRMLSDVSLTLPDGLTSIAPSHLCALRAGSETVITARLSGSSVKGDVVLRGKVSGEPFEAHYPIDVTAVSDEKNAFVPRLFAASTIDEKERFGTDADKAELVGLSRKYSVPSKFTSLLVLESEAMFTAFGIERAQRGAQWTGESAATGTVVADSSVSGKSGEDLSKDDEKKGPSPDELSDSLGSALATGSGQGFGAGGGFIGHAAAPKAARAESAPMDVAPSATMAPPVQARKAAPSNGPWSPNPWGDESPGWGRRRAGRWMKRTWVRHASVADDPFVASDTDKVRAAREALAQAPDERGKHKALALALSHSGDLDELDRVLTKWKERDPLDADMISLESDVVLRKGDRARAMRILSGALSSPTIANDDASRLATSLAEAYERQGDARSCSFRVTVAELRPSDADAVARASSCERTFGRMQASESWLSALPKAKERMDKLTRIDAERADSGAILLKATWDQAADVDLVIVTPQGERISWASRSRKMKAEDVTSQNREALALNDWGSGAFEVEAVRASPGSQPIDGRIVINAADGVRTIPFHISQDRARVGRVDVRYEPVLVPASPDDVGAFMNGE
jgi:Mg-chelatase subunit ChlD